MKTSDGDRKTGRVTIREVAEDAGVSVAAVSKVLRDAYGVSDTLRAKVRVSMDRLGYRPLAAARGMRGQTYTLGLIIPDLRNPFFADIMVGVNQALERTQYRALMGISENSVRTEMALVESMLDRQMDGIILIGSTEDRANHDKIAALKPLVTIGHHDPQADHFDTVNNNDQQGAMLAVRHLAANGYKNIAMLSLFSGTSTILAERELGYRRAMLEAGIAKNINIIQSSQSLRDVQLAARHLLEGPNRPDAIFCWTDFIALEVISVATEMGLSIPGDVGIVGYDNTMYCDLAQNGLSSIDQSGELLGLQSARLLIERIKGRQEAEHFVVTPRLVSRRSSMRLSR
ncbi:LacI family transcriptional regulator [Devosia sp. BK]|uniref:LacI family DNA-binding transcriptional regulator n=1 Tax=unclassified Devosia TaxID=196773 RepID=UPI000714D00D|nr:MULTISPECIES: LacI family DNA-binding transcriptional regulator [unclassified Devosia]KQN72496.1 LacI family transcriptional regulator [Devosia sp. Leaf64]KQT51739.1 LacI family transcriptional regulator [Devosia sp. Leaf420]MDV3251301.1 LacI family transcriptional regulator [Devosia sp. BK]